MKMFRTVAVHRSHAVDDDERRPVYRLESDELPPSMTASPAFWVAAFLALLAWVAIALIW